jgi:hypothetical protein
MKRILHSLTTTLFLFSAIALNAQKSVQTVRGTVTDNASNQPIAYATVVVLNSNPPAGTTTDEAGNFRITGVALGRYDVRVTSIGYEPALIREVIVGSARETFLSVNLKEDSRLLNEVVVRPNDTKALPLNPMATVSSRMLSMEEASRYAGGFDDLARLASSFAGVASNNGENGIMVRGNNPKFLQWKMEGVEIPNPNHFADLSSFGGGSLTAMSSQLVANSDFMTGAFPAEYGNALSGVFDIFMRNGNNQKYEHTFQIGIIGIDAASEGPINKKSGSSYLFNYRYSTLGLVMPLMPKTTDGITYQDLSFKLNFPTKKVGVFTLWGIGLIDHSGATEKKDSSLWYYDSDKENQDAYQFMASAGFTHKILLNNKSYLKTNLAATVNGIEFATERLDDSYQLNPYSDISTKNWNVVLSSFINTKFNAKHTNKTGFVFTEMMYDMQLQKSVQPNTPLQTLVNQQGSSSLISAFTSSNIRLTDQLNMNIGINSQVFTLNGNYTVEPRLGFKWQYLPNQSIGLAYGAHSRLERLNYYFTKDNAHNGALYNKDLDFTKANHLVLSHDWSISEFLHLRTELYYQQLYDVPVIADSSYSFLNLQADWFFNHKLESTGIGRNYGLDLSLEKYMSQGYYYMFTASLFQSQYQGGDHVWRNTRYNRNYLFNLLVGKEWQVGYGRQNVLSANVRLSYQGGDRYSPVKQAESIAQHRVVYDEAKAFSKQFSPSILAHFTMSYTVNKAKTAHEFALKVINMTQQCDYYGFKYNYITHGIDEDVSVVFIPNISYKVGF